ncbi:o-succinylbenzoate synthase [Auraticoccus sp. F435]|uniref:o-succinylbenzoate synthase n=1 Tax=Auraticoccus cholistanensis TaxID=2656650 RepID=A0A6A9V1T3_9ACTN|nr:o-succinylbenzoate synthase [Auraticoccus cholistanensis]MVA77552.1 o-succinylbenzoate synthase [Auraticoccus cholistanensis]
MTVVTAVLHRVRLPLVHTFRTSSHAKSHLEHVLVELHASDGTVGWGEIASPSAPYYCPDTVGTSWLVAEQHLLPTLLGTELSGPRDASATWSRVRGHQFAKAGVDAAVWTLHSARTGRPLAELLGGTRTEVVAGVSLGIEDTLDELLAQVQHHVDLGYPRVKLKIAPGWDVEPVRVVREAFGDLALHVDANGAYSGSEEHLAVLRRLDDFGLTMIEQPFAPRNWLTSARFAAEVDTPVCLDESVEELDDLRTMLALRAGSVLNIKVSRMGGLTAAVAAHDLAREHGVDVWCGGMHEFGIGRAANVALSSLPGFTLPSDVSSWDKYYARDVVVDGVRADRGVVAVPTRPGVGFEVDPDTLAEHRLDQLTLRA